MSYLKLAKKVEQKFNVTEPTSQSNDVPRLSSKDEIILTTKLIFPGVQVLSGEEVQKMNAKGYFDPSELAENQTREPGEEG